MVSGRMKKTKWIAVPNKKSYMRNSDLCPTVYLTKGHACLANVSNTLAHFLPENDSDLLHLNCISTFTDVYTQELVTVGTMMFCRPPFLTCNPNYGENIR